MTVKDGQPARLAHQHEVDSPDRPSRWTNDPSR